MRFAMAWVFIRRFIFPLISIFLCSSPVFAQGSESRDPKAIFERGQKALTEGRYSAAEQDFDQLLRMGMRSAETYANLGVVYMRTNRPDAAIRALDRAKKLAPTAPGIDLDLGLVYFKQHEFKKAAPHFKEVISADPGNTQARYLKGMSDFMTDDFAAAVDALAPIVDRERDDLEYLFMLGISYGMLKRTDDSRQVFEHLVEAGGDTPHLHLLLGKAYMALGQQEKAKSELERAIVGEPLPYAHYYLGVLYKQLGNTDSAAAEFTKEIEVAPDNPWAYKDLSAIKLDQADLRGAMAILEKGIARNPDTPDLLAALGKAYLQVPNAERAIQDLRRAIALDSKNSSYHYQLGRAYLKAGRGQEARAEMARAQTLMNDAAQSQMEQLSRDSGNHVPASEPQ
jgi:tetratricopeptide (TPR) repeat protein